MKGKLPSKARGKRAPKSRHTTKLCKMCGHRIIAGDCGYCITFKEV